ncbi:phosphate acetyltransferase, partial [Oscillospiraceae bacterium OttesenSCG-928-F05]|nr:phosphate acetyltransferase [Oscillospiraceae bacterium OttesenSCG-928-F05]
MSYLSKMIELAKSNKKTIVLPESEDIRTIQATAEILKRGIADVVLLGDPRAIAGLADGLDISGAKIIDPEHSPEFDAYVEAFYEMRKAKGVTPEAARETMKNSLYYGVMMVKKGAADGMVAGAINSTGNTLRPALQILKTAPGTKLVSSFFIMDVPDCDLG